MSTGRRTKAITFNLKDRGRQHTGQSRDNVDYQSWINLINSPATQEMINTGSSLGYYGHQIRILWGLNPPETVPVGDKLITISPAVRTIELSADQDGNVTHRQEFLETPEGDIAMRQYKAKIGGFSQANDYIDVNGTLVPTEYCGTDYVLQPNYATNIGDGVLLDSVHGGMVRAALEQSVIAMYDGIFGTNYANHIADENLMRAIDAENKLLAMQQEKEKRLQLQREKRMNMLDSALCPTLDIDQYFAEGTAFDHAQVVTSLDAEQKEKEKASPPRVLGGLFGFL